MSEIIEEKLVGYILISANYGSYNICNKTIVYSGRYLSCTQKEVDESGGIVCLSDKV